MEPNIKLGKVFGIDVGVNYSWFVIFCLITYTFWETFSSQHALWPDYMPIIAAVVASGLFFFSILGHELSHSLVALWNKLPVKSITLFVFGGVSYIEKEASSASMEFWVAVVGPLSSFLIAGIFWGLSLSVDSSSPMAVVAYWLALSNLMLAVFNLIPGFPLDGGRVLRAAIWGLSGSVQTGTRVASWAGQAFGYMLVFTGVLMAVVIRGNLLGGLWLAVIGWFLINAARVYRRPAVINDYVKTAQARDVMVSHADFVPAGISLQEFFDDHLIRTGRRCFIVNDNGRLLGLITAGELKKIDRSRWAALTVGQAMRPFDTMRWVAPTADLARVLELMDRDGVSQVPVVSDGHLEGLIGRDDLARYVETRAEFAR
ncbi:MAG TPA: site-2 protease family protein [Blastocatellia bacterium]